MVYSIDCRFAVGVVAPERTASFPDRSTPLPKLETRPTSQSRDRKVTWMPRSPTGRPSPSRPRPARMRLDTRSSASSCVRQTPRAYGLMVLDGMLRRQVPERRHLRRSCSGHKFLRWGASTPSCIGQLWLKPMRPSRPQRRTHLN
jgi:hypothetical protein